jgi:TonB family protein
MMRKINIMKAKPEVSDGEIQSYMNFDGVVTKHTEAVALKKSQMLFRIIGFGSIMAMLFFAWFYWPPSAEQESKVNELAPQDGPIATPESRDTATSQQQSVIETTIPKKEEDKSNASTRKKKPTREISVDTIAAKSNAVSTETIYKQAEPANGYPALYEYFGRELKYPAESIGDSIQGVVIAVFTINKLGVPENISIEQSLGPAFDRETLRVINRMPPWKAATYNQKPVNSRISLPLTFQIKKIKIQ